MQLLFIEKSSRQFQSELQSLYKGNLEQNKNYIQ